MTESPSRDTSLPINSDLGIYLTSQKDFTVYWSNSDGDHFPPCLHQKGNLGRQHSLVLEDGSLILVPYNSESTHPVGIRSINQKLKLVGDFFPKPPKLQDDFEGRVCACSCYDNAYVSATVRAKAAPNAQRKRHPVGKWKCGAWGKYHEYLIETVDLVEALWELVFPVASQGFPPSGLVVFAGSTNAGKSALAKSFALETIRQAQINEWNKDKTAFKMPHLVSYEDPIEDWSVSTRLSRLDAKDAARGEVVLRTPEDSAKRFDFYFTPRQKDADVADLESALLDAKRQTPACYFIGEVRRPSDWQRVIEFAGSGHLVVTTTHAATLNETLSRILAATKAETPTQRRSVVGCIAAALHVAPSPGPIAGMKVLLPAVWTRTGVSLNALVADGLSSVIPNGNSIYSRAQFVSRIGDYLAKTRDVADRLSQSVHRDLLKVARTMDRQDLELQ